MKQPLTSLQESSVSQEQLMSEKETLSSASEQSLPGDEAKTQGYFDAETSEKCIKVSKFHEEFCLDLKERDEKIKTDVQAYDVRLQELVNTQQTKVTHHSSKLSVGWHTVSKN